MMKPLTLVSVITEDYLPRAVPFLESLRRVQGTRRCCVTLGFKPSGSEILATPHVDFCPMPHHWSAYNNCVMQHGRFLDVIPNYSDDQLYLLSDADIVIQRDFTDAEICRLTDYDMETFGAGWNAYDGDNLQEEAKRLSMRDDGTFGTDWQSIPCYNTGVLVMRGYAWKRFRDLFESRCRGHRKLTTHKCQSQWLLCWCLHRLGLHADVLPWSLHTHGHFVPPVGTTLGPDRILRHNGEVVMFRHAI